jgi:hypothetical protein
LAAAPVYGTTADDLCMPTVDPCVVSQVVPVTPGSVIDVGMRRLLIANGGALVLDSGMMTLRAGSLSVDAGGRLDANGGVDETGGTIVVEAADIGIAGQVLARGEPGGFVNLMGTGPVRVSGSVEVRSTATDEPGGIVSVAGTTITVSGILDASGQRSESGGEIVISANDAVMLTGMLLASGGDGGGVDVTSATSVTVGATGVLRADAIAVSGSGGEVLIAASGDLVLNGLLSAFGLMAAVDDSGGDGGTIDVAGRAISGSGAAARINANGGSPDGLGGDIELAADAGALSYAGRMEALTPGNDGSGGSILLGAEGPVTLSGVVDLTATRGGDIDASAEDNFQVAATASITVAGIGGGEGGDIDLSSGAELIVDGSLVSDGGPGAGGAGGDIRLGGCIVRINASGRLSSMRAGGTNILVGRDRSIIAGTLRADPSTGRNEIRIAGPGYEPMFVTGSMVTPDATVVMDASIVPCNPLPTPTATPTTTATGTVTETGTPTQTLPPSATPTATPTPGGCVGDCDGNGEVSISDLIVGVNIALGNQPVSNCPAFDPDGTGMVTINELIQGVNNALNGCT